MNWSRLILLIFAIGFALTGIAAFIVLHHEDGVSEVRFSLKDAKGQAVTEAALHGHWSILSFGFTHCPDICPTGVKEISDALRILDERNVANSQGILIAVDYLRDTPKQVSDYLSHFNPDYRGFTGSQGQLDLATDSFNATYSVNLVGEGEAKQILVTHSPLIYLINPQGQIVKHFPQNINANAIVEQIEVLL